MKQLEKKNQNSTKQIFKKMLKAKTKGNKKKQKNYLKIQYTVHLSFAVAVCSLLSRAFSAFFPQVFYISEDGPQVSCEREK